MARHEIFTVGSTATQITPNGTHSGMDITIQNINASANIYVGGEGVTASDFGFKIIPGEPKPTKEEMLARLTEQAEQYGENVPQGLQDEIDRLTEELA